MRSCVTNSHETHPLESALDEQKKNLWESTSLPWLVGGWPTPLKNMSSSVGMIFPFPTVSGKIIQSCSSHHQPDDKFAVIAWKLIPTNDQSFANSPKQPEELGYNTWYLIIDYHDVPNHGLKKCPWSDRSSYNPATMGCLMGICRSSG